MVDQQASAGSLFDCDTKSFCLVDAKAAGCVSRTAMLLCKDQQWQSPTPGCPSLGHDQGLGWGEYGPLSSDLDHVLTSVSGSPIVRKYSVTLGERFPSVVGTSTAR